MTLVNYRTGPSIGIGRRWAHPANVRPVARIDCRLRHPWRNWSPRSKAGEHQYRSDGSVTSSSARFASRAAVLCRPGANFHADPQRPGIRQLEFRVATECHHATAMRANPPMSCAGRGSVWWGGR